MSSNLVNRPTRQHKLKWISHRGMAREADENTLEAFREARSHQFDGYETDLRTSKDGQLILSHDVTFERLGGPKAPVWDLSANAITSIRLADGCHPVLWETLLDEFGQERWTFDIKPEQGERTVRFLINQIRTNNWDERVVSGQYRFLFWNEQQQNKFLEAWPDAQCYARYDECRKAGLAYLLRVGWLNRPQPRKVYALPYQFKGIVLYRKEIVDYFHKYQAQVCAFLPEAGSQTNAAIASGFDEVLTNFPPVTD